MGAITTFISANGKRHFVNTNDIAYRYPSIANPETEFITLYSGQFFRAECIEEISHAPETRRYLTGHVSDS